MPVPERFKLKPPRAELVGQMSVLCDAIEDAAEDEVDKLLAEWNGYATRDHKQYEFRTYWKSVNKEVFVRAALHPQPQFVDDATYDEVRCMVESVMEAEGEEDEHSYYLAWLDTQFPGARISDLIYWPDHWFGDASLFREPNGAFKPETELSSDQIMAYAMLASKRQLPGAPEGIELPFQLPNK